MPGTSLGTEEIEKYLISREHGLSRRDSLIGLFPTNDYQKTGRRFEGMLECIVNRSKILLDVKPDHRLSNLKYLDMVCGKSKTLLVALNLYALSKGINGIAFNRINILLFKDIRTRLPLSLNMGTTPNNTAELDSS